MGSAAAPQSTKVVSAFSSPDAPLPNTVTPSRAITASPHRSSPHTPRHLPPLLPVSAPRGLAAHGAAALWASMNQPVADPTASVPVSAQPVGESPDERKRRLARERQRRHREKLRQRADSAPDISKKSAQNPAHVQPSPPATEDAATATGAQQTVAETATSLILPLKQATSRTTPPGQSHEDPTTVTAAAASGAVDVGVAVRDTHDSLDKVRSSQAVGRVTTRASRAAAANDAQIFNISRPGRHANASASSGLLDTPAKQTRARRAVQLHQTRQEVQQEAQRNQEQQADLEKRQQQQQQLEQQRQFHQQHAQAHDEQQRRHQVLAQQHHHQKLQQQHQEQQQQRQYKNLMRHASSLAAQNHGFSTATQPPQQSQALQTHGDTGFSFPSQPDSSVPHSQFVTSSQRQYLQDNGIPTAIQGRPYIRQPGQQPDAHRSASIPTVDAAAGLNSLSGTVNDIHSSLGGTVGGAAGSNSSPPGLGIGSAQASRFTVGAPAGTPGTLTQHTGIPGDGGHDDAALESYMQRPLESGEERKRRLARERQRRRRKRLKGETDSKDGMELGSRDDGPAVSTVVHPALSLPNQIRTNEGGSHSQATGQMPNGINQFEVGGLGSAHPIQSALQPIHVPGVTSGHDDLTVVNGNRSGFSNHTLAVGVSGPANPSSSEALVVPPVRMDLTRMPSGGSEAKEMPPLIANESAEQRKRRLARDRQRRRRLRLRQDKLGYDPLEKSPNSSQGNKATNDGSVVRIVDGADSRMVQELDRRVLVAVGIGDNDRIPIGSPGSAVFGGRGDVGQSLPFGDQPRTMRGSNSMADGGVNGIGLTFGTNAGLNLGVHVGGMTNGPQPQGAVIHWSQGFDSENSARYAVDNAVAAFRSHLANTNSNARAYILQQGVAMLLNTEDSVSRDMMNGAMLSSMRSVPDGVMRI